MPEQRNKSQNAKRPSPSPHGSRPNPAPNMNHSLNTPADRSASEDTALSAARLLWRHWQDGTVLEALPSGLRPTTRAGGYAVQARLAEVSGQAVSGWKIAATSAAGQAHIDVPGPLAGRLLAGHVDPDGATLPLRGNRMRVAEPEFAFRFERSLPPRARPYETDEVLAAVADLHPSIEVPDSRFTDFARAGEAQLVADNACAGRFVLGPAAPAGWRRLDLAAHAVQARATPNDQPPWQREGTGANVLGDPRVALAWLVNELSLLGIPLMAGGIVTTGTCMTPLPVAGGVAVQADFGSLGRVSARFSEP
jgi:2-keto-4-pentenoate hydratase